MRISISDHEKLHDNVGRAVLVGAGCAVLSLFLPRVYAMPLLAVGLALSIVPPISIADAALVLALGCAVGGAALAKLPLLAAIPFAIMVARGQRGQSLWFSSLIGAAGWLVTMRFGAAVLERGTLAMLPSGFEALIVGATSGFLIGVGSIGRHLRIQKNDDVKSMPMPSIDPATATNATSNATAATATATSGAPTDELSILMARAKRARDQATQVLGESQPMAITAANDLIERMTGYVGRWLELARDTAGADRVALAAQVKMIEDKRDRADDAQVKADFERAVQAFRCQLEYLDEIERGKARAEAKLLHHIALLERLRMAALHHRSVDAARLGGELSSVVEELTEAGGELDVSAAAIKEADEADAPLALAALASTN